MKAFQTDKSYYLTRWRSVTIGVILVLLGIALTFIGFDGSRSFWDNFQGMLLDFRSAGSFLVSLLMLVFKAGFIGLGILFFKNRDNIIRAKITSEGFYFKRITGSNKYERGLSDLNPLVLIPYKEIVDIRLVRSFWQGLRLELETMQGREILTMLNVLTKREKIEICASVKNTLIKMNAFKDKAPEA